jgi:NAD+--asparagine ADP-ribosyltransferase
MSHLPSTLNSFWLWREVSSKLGVSNPAYKYWKNTPNIKLNNKYVFIQKDKLPQKHMHIQDILTDLSGHLPIKFASDQLHVNEHIFSYEKMKFYKEFEYKFVEDVKFVNIKKFFRENGIRVSKNSIVQLGKMKDIELSVDSTLYRLKDDYAVVVYE